MARLLSTLSLALFCYVATSCDDAVSPDGLAGTYVATTFTFSGLVSGDVLNAGGSLSVTINSDGTAEGDLYVPASLAGGQPLAMDLEGTYEVAGDTITFEHEADTFVRDAVWTVHGSELRGSGTFSGVTITVVLTRQ